MTVRLCENSTITEAWAVVIGEPGTENSIESPSVQNTAIKELGELKEIPTFVAIGKQVLEKIPPFWSRQVTWNKGKYLTRLGHRYLSVHYIRTGDDKYDQYENTLEQPISTWLKAYRETVEGNSDNYPIDRVGFGYINFFKFDSEKFDLSQYFKVTFATGVKYAHNGLSVLEVEYAFNYSETITVSVNLKVKPENDALLVITKVESYLDVQENMTFENNELILDQIAEAKEAAKKTFFDLATKATHEIMGAK